MTNASTNKPAAPAAKTAAKTPANKNSIKNQPSDAELAQKREEERKGFEGEVKVKTASGNNMWDPDASAWIRGERTLATETPWLQRQIKAKKIEVIK